MGSEYSFNGSDSYLSYAVVRSLVNSPMVQKHMKDFFNYIINFKTKLNCSLV